MRQFDVAAILTMNGADIMEVTIKFDKLNSYVSYYVQLQQGVNPGDIAARFLNLGQEHYPLDKSIQDTETH